MDEFVSEHGGVLISVLVSVVLVTVILVVVSVVGSMNVYSLTSIIGE